MNNIDNSQIRWRVVERPSTKVLNRQLRRALAKSKRRTIAHYARDHAVSVNTQRYEGELLIRNKSPRPPVHTCLLCLRGA